MFEQDQMHRSLLCQSLYSLGDFASLRLRVNLEDFYTEIKAFESHWMPYNTRKPGYNRFGLSVINKSGQLNEGSDLDSLHEQQRENPNATKITETDFNQMTEVFEKCPSIHPLVNAFYPDLGRSHFIRLDKGGYFPPHRDSLGLIPSTFRILVPCLNCETHQFVFLLNGQRIFLNPGQAYFLNTRIEHAVFSFANQSSQLVLNVPINEKTVRTVIENLDAY